METLPPNDAEDVPPPNYITDFDDMRGWFHAWRYSEYSWRACGDDTRSTRLYYPASLQYNGGDYFVAVDGLGRRKGGYTRFACTINPSSGKLERLCVQTRDSLCRLNNSTWDRTVIRNTAPTLFRLANFPLGAIPHGRRDQPGLWTSKEWTFVLIRWAAASLGIAIMLFLPGHGQPIGKDPRAYLPFLYNGYRYPRLARNFWENRKEIKETRLGDPSWTSGDIGTYRAFRPRFLCYLVQKKVKDNNGNEVLRPWFEARPVKMNDNSPYVFISYTKTQFNSENEEEKNKNYQSLYSMAIREAFIYSHSVQDSGRKPVAFWIDTHCQPHTRYIEKENRIEDVTDPDERKTITDQDVYTISDIIRGAEHVIVIARNSPSDDPNTQNEALQGWGKRVWTLPEVILSKGDSVTITTKLDQRERIAKVRLAEIAWPDAGESRQLVEHFTNLPLSRLELVSIAMKCLNNRTIKAEYRGDRSYALMGLLRVRPRIDTSDSSFQAFARLSLPQDNDRLMERLICLLPEHPDEPWNKMSDQYKSILWDIIPGTQVCGIGENDTVIVDGFKGALIQWSKFSTILTTKRMSWKRTTLIYITAFLPVLFFAGLFVLAASRTAAIAIIVISLALLATTPAYIPHLYKGKLTEVEPCLFGVEGYIPLPNIEENLFGARMGRLKWSPYGSPLSQHRYRKYYRERLDAEDAGAPQPLVDLSVNKSCDVFGYPVEAIDPLTADGTGIDCISAETMSRSPYGSMKLFTVIDTLSMTATLFEARRPPVALLIGGSEGGMKRALACSYDVSTGTLYRETVLRVPSQVVDKMHSLQRVRLGLKNPLGERDVTGVSLKPVSPVDVTGAPTPSTHSILVEQHA